MIFGTRPDARIGGESGPARLSSIAPPFDFTLLQEDVGRLQVAVDDPFSVGHVDGTGQRLDERGRLARRPGLAIQSVRQAAALDPLQGQEGPALVAADLVDLHDVGVLHPRRQLRLQPEPQLLGGGSELARQHHLQGRQPVEAPVPRLVHHPHASATDLGQDVVVPDLPGGRENHRCGSRISASRGCPGRLPPAQGANRRAALGRADERLFPRRGALLEPRQQWIVGGQLIDATATRGTVAEVGRDAGQLRLRELAQETAHAALRRRVVQRGSSDTASLQGSSDGQETTRFPAEEKRQPDGKPNTIADASGQLDGTANCPDSRSDGECVQVSR